MNQNEQQRRFILLSLLSKEGLDCLVYRDRFSSDAFNDFPQLQQLIDWNLATLQVDRLTLTESGIERSDAIGPWLFSDRVHLLMNQYTLK